MGQLAHVTFSGADHTVDLRELGAFLGSYRPGSIELGVLVSQKQQRSERYPTPELAVTLLKLAAENGQRSAVHLCGSLGRRLVSHGVDSAFADAAEVWLSAVWLAERVQINHPEPDANAEEARRCVLGLGKPVIFQLRKTETVPFAQGEWCESFPMLPEGATWLYDQSAGTGREPDYWPVLPTRRGLVGYAGGIGPHNVALVVKTIRETLPGSPARYWIDMESGVRERVGEQPDSATAFSLIRCRAVMDAVAPFFSQAEDRPLVGCR